MPWHCPERRRAAPWVPLGRHRVPARRQTSCLPTGNMLILRRRTAIFVATLCWVVAYGAPVAAGEPSGPPANLRAEPPAAGAALRAEVDRGQAVVVWEGGRALGRIDRGAVETSGVLGQYRITEFREALADVGRRRVLLSVRYGAPGAVNGPVAILQADPDGRNLATLFTWEGREARGLALSPDGRLLAFVVPWEISTCERLAWPLLLDLARPRDPEVWLPATLFLRDEEGELPHFHVVRWREDGTLEIGNRPITPSPECRALPPRDLAFDPQTRWFKPPVPSALELRLRAGQALQGFFEAVAKGDVGGAYERLSPAAQRQMPMETFRERFARRPPAFTNGVRADDNRVTFRFLTHDQQAYYFYTLIPIGGTWRIAAIRERPTSSPWPD